MKLIKNATVYTMNENNEVIENCDILIKDGKIKNIGPNLSQYQEINVIEANGYFITPGLIDSHTHVGILGEITDGMRDHNEFSSPYTPLMSAIDAINPHHNSFKEARSNGVTTVQTGNGSHNVIGGVWTVVKTSGTVVEDMILRRRSGLKGALGENPKNRHGKKRKSDPFTRMSIAKWMRYGFTRAKKAMNEGKDSLDKLYSKKEEDLIPFIEVLQRKMPLRVHAHRADDIITSIRIAREFDIDLSIEHGTEAFKVLPHVIEAGYPITLGPFMGNLGKYEVRNMNLENPRILNEAGLLIAISTDHPFDPIQYLSICAATAVKHGLEEMEGLRSITINPAIICDVDDRVGSIEIDKDADLVLWSHHPFKTRAKVMVTLIDGNLVFQNSESFA